MYVLIWVYYVQFSMEKRSIFAAGDISQFIPDGEADVAVLEEPEHLTWYYHGKRWTDKFQHVVGIVHTNYLEYVKREKNGPVQAFLLEHVNNWMVRVYCNKVRSSLSLSMLSFRSKFILIFCSFSSFSQTGLGQWKVSLLIDSSKTHIIILGVTSGQILLKYRFLSFARVINVCCEILRYCGYQQLLRSYQSHPCAMFMEWAPNSWR